MLTLSLLLLNLELILVYSCKYEYRKRDLDDQSIFWSMMRARDNATTAFVGQCTDLPSPTKETKDTLQTCVLDPCLFSSGMMRGPHRFSTFYASFCFNIDYRLFIFLEIM